MGLANISTTVLLAVAFISGWAAGETVAQGTGPDPREARQLLLLKNGQIIEGHVNQKFDNVLLTTSDGSRLVFQKDEVETLCDSPAEAYWHKAAANQSHRPRRPEKALSLVPESAATAICGKSDRHHFDDGHQSFGSRLPASPIDRRG